jgi:hypothetical protein
MKDRGDMTLRMTGDAVQIPSEGYSSLAELTQQ